MNRPQTAKAIATLMPYIIQGAHLGGMKIKGITQSQFFTLILLHTNSSMPMNALAERVGVKLPTMTGMVNRLVKSGYIKRVLHETDRRQVWVELTPKGKGMLHEFQGALRRRWEDVLAILDDSQVKQFYRIVEKLISRLGAI